MKFRRRQNKLDIMREEILKVDLEVAKSRKRSADFEARANEVRLQAEEHRAQAELLRVQYYSQFIQSSPEPQNEI